MYSPGCGRGAAAARHSTVPKVANQCHLRPRDYMEAPPVHHGVPVDLPSPPLDYLIVREGGVPQRPYLSPPPDSAKRRARRAFGNRG
jgi:hypothetical protein